MIENYLPILIVFILAVSFVFVSLILSHFVGPRINNKVKMMPYESGVDPVGETRIRFSKSQTPTDKLSIAGYQECVQKTTASKLNILTVFCLYKPTIL